MAPVTQSDSGWCVMRNKQMNWLLAVGAVALLGTAVVTLRAAEQATQRAATSAVRGESASAGSDVRTPWRRLRAHEATSAGVCAGGVRDDHGRSHDSAGSISVCGQQRQLPHRHLMPHFALELDDRAVAIATDGRVLSSAPSAVFDGTAGTTVGANAWRELRVRPRAISTRHLSAVLTQRGTSVRAEDAARSGVETATS